MSDPVIAAIIGGIAGLATGVVGSLIAPWVNWGVDKRRLRYERRRDLITEWREGLVAAERDGLFGDGEYQSLAWYQSFRSHLLPSRWSRIKSWVKRRWFWIRRKPLPVETPPIRTLLVTEGSARWATAEAIATKIEQLSKRWRIE